MNSDIKLLNTLANSLNNSLPVINKILSSDKQEFSNNNEYITIAIGIINEIKEISLNLSDDLCFINKNLYENLRSITIYSNNIFDTFNLVNTYKLYDCLKIDVITLINYLNK